MIIYFCIVYYKKMNEYINCYIKDLNFAGLGNYLFENLKHIEEICTCVCSHNITIIINILEKCGKKIKNKNILDQLHNEITSEEHFDIVSLHIRNYIYFLYKIIYHFDKIQSIENKKKLCENFLTFSIYLIIYYQENGFVEQLLISLIHNFEAKRKNGYNKYILFQLEKNFYDLYCFIHLPDFIFINSFLIYSFALLCDNPNDITNNNFNDIITNLQKINTFFEKIHSNIYNENSHADLIDDIYISSQKINKAKNNYHTKYLKKTKMIHDTISNDNIKIIYNQKDHFSLLYKYINLFFDTNIYSLDENDYEENYNATNINVNNFLLLLKIISPSFLIWTAINTKFKHDEKNKCDKNYTIAQNSNNTEITIQKYKYKHMYIIDNTENINYLKQTSDCFFFFFWYLLSLNQTRTKSNESINTLMVHIINHFFLFFQRCHHFVDSENERQILSYDHFINKKNLETYLCKGNQNELINNPQNKEKKYLMYTSIHYNNTFCQITSEHLFRNKNKILLNLKNLIIWGYISPDDTEEMNFFNIANIFIFNNNTCDVFKRHENVHQYIHKFFSNEEDIFLFYNYALFKKTYECKTLSFKYMDNFSNYISSFILNIIFTITKYYLTSSFFCGQVKIKNSIIKEKNSEQAIILAKKNKPEIKEQKTKQNKINGNNDINDNGKIDSKLLPNGEYNNIETNHLSNLLPKENTLNELSSNIINLYFHFKNYTYDERIEYLFNELLFICFKFINYPLKHVQLCCLGIIMEIITKMNIYNHTEYIDKKSDTFITFLYDESFDKNEIIKCYIHIKCKLKNHIHINLVKSIEHLIQICNLKLCNKTLCSIICKHILISFNYHPSLLPIILYKYIKIIIYLMESNSINIILDSLKCLHILYKINPQEIKTFNHDIIYRLHLLFNIFNQNEKNVENHISFNSIKQYEHSKDNNNISSNSITSYLKRFYFNNIQIEKRREEMLLHIKLILYSIYIITPPDEYLSSLKIFEYYPKEYEVYSKNFETFSTF
ncbi:conserved Plasmodium protein, unknown function [Plasmodium sp. gorilla clade G3]|nr:conserved Plasmodium protein, unknown function [Plasmodium sp. gorilla clade G3]